MQSDGLEGRMEERKRSIEDIMHRYLGVTIKELNDDITSRLSDPLLDFDVEEGLILKDAKKKFHRRFLLRSLTKHHGNVSAAAKEAKVDRRTLHRMINEAGIDAQQFRARSAQRYADEDAVNAVIETSLKKYEEIIHPSKLDVMYRNVTTVSRDILEHVPPEASLSLKEAEREFERRFLFRTLKKHDYRITKAAKALGIRYETLHRKLSYLKRQ